jgi:hypothetical protein
MRAGGVVAQAERDQPVGHLDGAGVGLGRRQRMLEQLDEET